jgi:RNA polymerase sigma-70 factor (ECF subfamily)
MIRDRKRIESLDFSEVKDDDVFKSIENNELANKIEKALFTLSDNERSIFILKEFENYSYKEIAELMDIPIGTVMSKLFYARKKLAEKLRGVI